MSPINLKDSSDQGKGQIRSCTSTRGSENLANVRARYSSRNWHREQYTFDTRRSASNTINTSFTSTESSYERHRRRRHRSGTTSTTDSSFESVRSNSSNHRSTLDMSSSATNSSSSGSATPPFETDPVALARREKQIDYGKTTLEYEAYLAQVPKARRSQAHPKTPDRTLKCSRRNWDAQVKIWRLLLHAFNPQNQAVKPEEINTGEKDAKNEEDGAIISLYFSPMETDEKACGSASISSTPGKSDHPEN